MQSSCSTPDSGISVGTPYGSVPTAMLTPLTAPVEGFSPLSSYYFGGPTLVAQQPNISFGIGDEQVDRKRKLNVTRRTRRDYCNLCQSTIHAEGRRSQGPRRHALQFHVMKPLYKCKLCDYSSSYDKYHIVSHARRVHGINRPRDVLLNNTAEFESDIQYWTQRCFGANVNELSESQSATGALTTTGLGLNMRNETPAPARKKVCGFAVHDLLADNDDAECSQKIISTKVQSMMKYYHILPLLGVLFTSISSDALSLFWPIPIKKLVNLFAASGS
ncbi:Formin-homology and zinc finger domains protein 1 [Toxocara canis]|uniref:Formin-homology and zinc finger domains protein 1 n=1 Tax=Toxocara canis TaxID=6265 RepID=A0A0B2VF50_TOXCA|nr:Formin-homology and zinc finger domains protein 1 [Toxocara canis]